MHSETEIRSAVKLLVDYYGELSTTEVKQRLDEVLVFDADDKIMSTVRNEMMIIQRIGNIVSHQDPKIKVYEEGFCVDKSVTPAIFYPAIGLSGKKVAMNPNQRAYRKQQLKNINRRRQGYKIDWDVENERRSNIGLKGELFFYQQELARVGTYDSHPERIVTHLSLVQGDGFGYDIYSMDQNGNPLYFEVKTTTGGINTPFYMSKNEKTFFEEHASDNMARLIRIYNFNEQSGRGDIQEILASNLMKYYDFDPVNFLVRKK